MENKATLLFTLAILATFLYAPGGSADVAPSGPTVAQLLLNGVQIANGATIGQAQLDKTDEMSFSLIYTQDMDVLAIPKISYSEDVLRSCDETKWKNSRELIFSCYLPQDSKFDKIPVKISVEGSSARTLQSPDPYEINLVLDTIAPTVNEFSLSKDIVKASLEEIKVELTFSEEMNGNAAPQIIFQGAPAGMFTFTSGAWPKECKAKCAEPIYEATFSVDTSIPFEGTAYVTVLGGEDVAGNPLDTSSLEAIPLRINTISPYVRGVTYLPPFNGGRINLESFESGEQFVMEFLYTKDVSTSYDPKLKMGKEKMFDCEGTWEFRESKKKDTSKGIFAPIPQDTYWVETCKIGKEPSQGKIAYTLSGARGLNDNEQVVFEGEILVDTVAPTVGSFTLNKDTVNAGLQSIMVTLTFSEEMNGNAAPQIIFQGAPAGMFTFTSGAWPKDCGGAKCATPTYEATFSVDTSIPFEGTAYVTVLGGEDVAGNPLDTSALESVELPIDTFPPVIGVVRASFGAPYEDGIINIEKVEKGEPLKISAEYSGRVDTAHAPSLVLDYGPRNGGRAVYGPTVIRIQVGNSAERASLPDQRIFSCKEGEWSETKEGNYIWAQTCVFRDGHFRPFEGTISVRIFGASDIYGRKQREYQIGSILFDTIAPSRPTLTGPNRLTRKSIGGLWGWFNLSFGERIDWERVSFLFDERLGEDLGIGSATGVPSSDGKAHSFAFEIKESAIRGQTSFGIEEIYDLAGNPYEGEILHPFEVDTLTPSIYASRVMIGANSNNTAKFVYGITEYGLASDDSFQECWYELDGITYGLEKCPSEESRELSVTAFGIPNGAHTAQFFAKSGNGIGASEPIVFSTSTTRFYLFPELIGGNITVNRTGIIYILPSSPATKIYIQNGTQGVSLNLSAVKSGNAATIPSDLEIYVQTSKGTVYLRIPANTTITGSPSWGGRLVLPRVWGNLSPTIDPGYESATNSLVIFAGWMDGLTFDKPVMLLLPGQAGLFAGFQANHTNGSTFEKIGGCIGDSPPEAYDACKYDFGSDLVIWTWHFSLFGTYTQTPIPAPSPAPVPSPPAPSNNAGGPVFFPAPTPAPAPASQETFEEEQPAATNPREVELVPNIPANPLPVNTFEGAQPEAPTAAALNEQPSQQSDLVASLFGENGLIKDMMPILAVGGAVALAGGAVYMLVMNRKKQDQENF